MQKSKRWKALCVEILPQLPRYGEKIEEVYNLNDWVCPRCRGICNCSVCKKNNDQEPTDQEPKGFKTYPNKTKKARREELQEVCNDNKVEWKRNPNDKLKTKVEGFFTPCQPHSPAEQHPIVPGGKLNRGLSVIDSYQLLKEGQALNDDEIFQASPLGWCIEWLQAYFLVRDDIMDNSHTRCGQPCWFRVPQVGMIAANDGILLRNHIPRIPRKHFKGKPYYVELLDLFDEAEFQTAAGQMIDLITTLEGEKDLSKYTLSLHRRIVQYKTAYYSFYLPVACALLMAGENLDNHVDVKNILVEMGTYFHVQDDYLDCFGDPETIGKIGTDIEDFKCSWLVVKALELCNSQDPL